MCVYIYIYVYIYRVFSVPVPLEAVVEKAAVATQESHRTKW